MNENREKNVLDLLEKRQYVSVEEVSHAFDVSDSTTRRIFGELQNKGLITRTHGGAKINDANNAAPNFTSVSTKNLSLVG